MIEAFIVNSKRYREGNLEGEYLKLPASSADVQALLKQIHVDGVKYKEICITEYKTDIFGLSNYLHEDDNLDELNYLAILIESLSSYEEDKFAAAVEYEEHSSSLKELINLTQNLDYYEYISGIENAEDYGRYCIEELGFENIPENLKQYFDYDAYGRDIAEEEGGCFLNNGYIVVGWNSSFIEHYGGREDIPEEYRIFAYPEITSIRDTLKHYQQIINTAPTIPKPERRPEKTEH